MPASATQTPAAATATACAREPIPMTRSGRTSDTAPTANATTPPSTSATASRLSIRCFHLPPALHVDGCRRSHHIPLSGGRVRREPIEGKRADVDARIVPHDQVGEDAAGSGRMLEPMAAEAVDQKKA